jgi:ORF6N domain
MASLRSTPITAAAIAGRIRLVRGHRVLLDSELAALYQVETKSLNLAVRRNAARFPQDFMFQLTTAEFANLRFQIETSSSYGGRRHRPFVFTEHGVAMLSSVLRSRRAVQVNIEIMRTFVRLREVLATNASLARKLSALEAKYDGQFKVVFDAIRQLMAAPQPRRRGIGFTADLEK